MRRSTGRSREGRALPPRARRARGGAYPHKQPCRRGRGGDQGLQANVGEKDLASIRVGAPVRVTTTGAAAPAITARVTSIFPFVDQGPRTAVVEAVVENPGRRFLPGQYVTMELVTGERRDALSVPRGALARIGGKSTVWVALDGRAEAREVTAGVENPERVEIASGLSGQEQVIVRGHEGLYAGARVTPAAPPAPTGAPAAPDKEMPGMKTTPGMKDMPGMK